MRAEIKYHKKEKKMLQVHFFSIIKRKSLEGPIRIKQVLWRCCISQALCNLRRSRRWH